MPTFYEYTCSSGGRFTLFRSVADRNEPAQCAAGGTAWRVLSVPVIHWPKSLWNQWSDVYPDTSPKEMAKRKDVERYDPNLANKPTPPPVDVRRYIPDRTEAEGASERLRLQPVEGEGPYV